MKIHLKIAYIVLFALSSGCETPTKPPASGTQQEPAPQSSDYITGEVKEIMQGKDGYTAKISTTSGFYFVTISHANLKDPAQYKSTAVGQTIAVKGDMWKMENENHITVRELKQ